MSSPRLSFLAICLTLVAALPTRAATPAATELRLEFAGVTYQHRWSQQTQHEFTPVGQEDLKQWQDMVTVNVHPAVHDGEALAGIANAVLGNYQRARGRVLRTASVPRTPERPAEHFAAVVLGTSEFLEIAFTRLKLHQGTGVVLTYSHRIYGKTAGNDASAWLKAHGGEIEKALMAFQNFPALPDLKPSE